MKHISIGEAVDVFMKNKIEILKAARSQDAGTGYRILAKVDNEGNWCGAGIVTPDTGSLLAHQKTGFALYVDCDKFKSRTSITEEILDWEVQITEKEKESYRVSEKQDNEYEANQVTDRDFFDDDFLGRGR